MPQALDEFDRFDAVAQKQFVEHIGRLLRGQQRFKRLQPGMELRADGARFLGRAAKDLRILFDDASGTITLYHLVRRNDRRFFNGEF